MKNVVVCFRRDLTINLGDYSNAKIGAPFPSAECEDGEDPHDAFQKLKAMNLAVMREEVLEVTAASGSWIRSRALAMVGVEEELVEKSVESFIPADYDDDDEGGLSRDEQEQTEPVDTAG